MLINSLKQNKDKGVFLSVILGWLAHVISPFLNLKADFVHIFFRREGMELLGVRYKSFWVLMSIMTVTFIAIGFSNGSLRYLREKMSDPFINWVNVELPWGNENLANEISNSLDDEQIKKDFNFVSFEGYYKYDLLFRDVKRAGTFRSMGRTIEFDNPLLDVIFEKKNLISGRRFDSETDLGLIVTESFLSQFNYNKHSSHIFMTYSLRDEDGDTDIPLPVIAIVRELPDMAAFATTPYFYNQRFLDTQGLNPFNPEHTSDLVLYVPFSGDKYQEFQNMVEKAVHSIEDCKDRSPYLSNQDYLAAHTGGKELRISFFPAFESLSEVQSVFSDLKRVAGLNDNEIIQLYDPKTVGAYEYRSYDYYAINFSSLDKIRGFKDFLFSENKIELEMSQIDSKENFNFVTKLTRFISVVLLGFCILSISIFLSNLLKNHLHKIKMNIGTFKAFGLGRNQLKGIYISIIGIFIALSIIGSLILSSLFGNFGGIRLILSILQIELEAGQHYFALIDWWTLFAIFSIIVVSLSSIYINNNNLMNDTPGNLINNRDYTSSTKTNKKNQTMKRKISILGFWVIALFGFNVTAQQKVSVEQILGSPVKFENEFIKTDGLVTSFVPSDANTTSYYILKGDYGQVIRVNTSLGEPTTDEKVCITGTVYVNYTDKGKVSRIFISERSRYDGVCKDVPLIEVGQSRLNFGETKPNQSVQKKLKIDNTGREDLVIDEIAVSDRNVFEVVMPSRLTIEPDKSAEVLLIFTPKEKGEFSGFVTIKHNAGNTIETIEVSGIVKDNNWLLYSIIAAGVLLFGLLLALLLRRRPVPAISKETYVKKVETEAPLKDPEIFVREDYNTVIVPRSDPKTVKFFPGEFEIVSGQDKGHKFRLPGYNLNGDLIITVGRETPSADRAQYHIQLKENTVGRKQAEIIFREGKTYLKSIGTTNLSVVDGQAIPANEIVEIKANSVMQFGEVWLAYRDK